MAAERQSPAGDPADPYDAMLRALGARTKRRQLMAELRDLEERYPEIVGEEGAEPAAPPSNGRRYNKRPPGTEGHKSHMEGVEKRIAARWEGRTPKAGARKKKAKPAPEPTPEPEGSGEPAVVPQVDIPASYTISQVVLFVLYKLGELPAPTLTKILLASGWNHTSSKKKGWPTLVSVTLSRMVKVNKTVKNHDGLWELTAAGRTAAEQLPEPS